MLKCDLDAKKGTARVEVHGSFMDITADIIYTIGDIYGAFQRDNPLSADMFKYFMKRAMDDDSPAWDLKEPDSKQEDGIKSIHIQVPKDFTDGLMGYEHAE